MALIMRITKSILGQPVTLGTANNLHDLLPGKCESCQLSPRAEVLEKYVKIRRRVEKVLNSNEIPQGAPEKCLRFVPNRK